MMSAAPSAPELERERDRLPGRGGAVWRTARGPLSLERPRILGILNVTPDSFSDGGRYATLDRALGHAEAMLDAGADLVDVGGESTRPGARTVEAAEELRRVMPVVRELTKRFPDALISVDTVKADVARAVMTEGAAVINDVSGLRLDPEVGRVAAESRAGLVLMHSRDGIDRMASYETAVYGDDAVAEIRDELAQALARASQAGVSMDAVIVDPGLGFSKRTEQSVAVIAHVDRLLDLGRPVLVGPSRKRFVGELAGGLPADQRLEGTLAACVAALLGGARLFRVHDVAAARRALDVAEAIHAS